MKKHELGKRFLLFHFSKLFIYMKSIYFYSYRCHQPGHIVRDCNKHSQPIQCDHCNGFGHTARDCKIVLPCCDCSEIEYRENNSQYPSIQKNYSQPNSKIEIRKGYLTNQHVIEIFLLQTNSLKLLICFFFLNRLIQLWYVHHLIYYESLSYKQLVLTFEMHMNNEKI